MGYQKIFKYIFAVFITFVPLYIYPEISVVTAQWDPVQCEATCIENLKKWLEKNNRIADLKMKASSGIATFRWKKETSFDFLFIKGAFQMVGLGLRTVRLEALGKVKWKGGNAPEFTSTGDNTVFYLYGPYKNNPINYNQEGSLTSYPLTEKMKKDLHEAAEKDLDVQIQAQVYTSMSIPLNLILSSVRVIPPKEEKEK